jgi:phosphopantothenoylcysteine decarboxylase/phosphopantothenate--cysteine ligase
MNPQMWDNKATQHNLETLKSRDIDILMPDSGEMACGEIGVGRLPDPEVICAEILGHLSGQKKPLSGYKALVTAGPTYEKIDPVRFIGNRSSGKQGYASALALHKQGAEVHLVSGPTALAAPKGVHIYNVESADEMLAASLKALPADIAICTAAVSDWRVENSTDEKLKKQGDGTPPTLNFAETPDILKTLASHESLRPSLLIGFAAETHNAEQNARDKLTRKGCDVLLVNEVSADNAVFGADHNRVDYLSHNSDGNTVDKESWPYMSKADVANMLVSKIIQQLEKTECLTHTQHSTTKLEATK